MCREIFSLGKKGDMSGLTCDNRSDDQRQLNYKSFNIQTQFLFQSQQKCDNCGLWSPLSKKFPILEIQSSLNLQIASNKLFPAALNSILLRNIEIISGRKKDQPWSMDRALGTGLKRCQVGWQKRESN